MIEVEEVLKLLHSKNRCLEKFLVHSKNFLLKLEKGDFSELSAMEKRRSMNLKAFAMYDRQISDAISRLSPLEKTPALIAAAKEADLIRETLVNSILKTDNKIILLIEQEQLRLQKELQSSEKNMNIMKKFKSQWIAEGGESLDGTI